MNTKFVAILRSTAALSLSLTAGAALAASSFTDEASFTAALGGAGVTIESFESTPGGTSTAMVFPTTTVSCSGSLCALPFFFGTSSLLPTLGSRSVFFATPNTITFSFSDLITAFGIDVRGLGTAGATDFSGTLSNNSSATFFSNYTGTDAQMRFVGFVDTSGFTSVTFSSTAPGDGIYFDRMQIAAVPEPGTYAMLLAGLGVLGSIAWRRNKRVDA